MVNNSTNINKTNNHISPKESLNSDGQQNEQSHLTLNHWAQKEHNNICWLKSRSWLGTYMNM